MGEFYRHPSSVGGRRQVCKSCLRASAREAYHQSGGAERSREYRKCNPERQAAYGKLKYARHGEKIRQRQREYYWKNREERKSYNAQYQKKNPQKWRAYVSLRRAKKLRAIPPWADLEAIERFYENCPEGYHVDHIIPLQGELVSGLHILENLQYLSAQDNQMKSNKVNISEITRFPTCPVRASVISN